VNLASRLEAANKEYGTRSLVSETTIAAIMSSVEIREIDRLIVFGQTQPQRVFEILGETGALTAAQSAMRDRYAEGLSAYRAQRWQDARAAFKAVLETAPDDGPSLTLLKRIDAFESEPPLPGWDGAWQMH